MAIAAASSFSVGVYYSPLHGVNSSWVKTTVDGCRASDLSGMRWVKEGEKVNLNTLLLVALEMVLLSKGDMKIYEVIMSEIKKN
ncbi:hypothetical protein SCA6_016653 [Theobroma cacao]